MLTGSSLYMPPFRNFEMALALVNIQGPRMSVQAVQVLNDLACVHISKGDFDGARQRIR